MVNPEQPTGALGRGLRLGRLGMSVGASYLAYQLQNLFLDARDRPARLRRFHQRASRRCREELQSLKGPAMKVGQMLSMQGALLPPEALEELARLQMHAPAMHPALARAQFRASLGRYPEAAFRAFDPEPFAAASLGQVHRAVSRDGEPVAVKIQYPAIRSAVQNDFKLLRSASVAGQITGHFPKALIEELEMRILQETDYLNEGRNLERLGGALRPLTYVRVPRVRWELTTDRVLTMSLLEGVPLGEWLAGKPTAALRDRAGSRLYELFFFQVFQARLLHADPHPGNYLFGPEGEIGLVDFGCVKDVTPGVIEVFHRFLDETGEPLERRLARLLQSLWGDKIGPKSPEARGLLAATLEFSQAIFPPPGAGDGRVDFGQPRILQALLRLAEEILRRKLILPEFVFYKRAEVGLYNYLHQLKARVDVRGIVGRLRPAETTLPAPPGQIRTGRPGSERAAKRAVS